MPGGTRILKRGEIDGLLSLGECMDAVGQAFAGHHLGRALGPELMHVDGLGGEFHIKGGGTAVTLGGRVYFALKANAGFFGNPAKGLPSIRGVILLYDASDGTLLSVMDSRDVTAIRTAATTGLAASILSRPDATVVAIAGCGGQALRQVQGVLHARPGILRVRVWSRDAARARDFCSRHRAVVSAELEACEHLAAATRDADVLVTCTPAKGAFVRPEHVRTGMFIAAVGADSPLKQELDPLILARGRVVTDLTAQCAEVGELHHAIAAGVMGAGDVYAQIGELCAGAKPGGWTPDRVTVFDSTGTALQDAAAAALVFERAQAGGRGVVVDFME